MPTIPTYTAEEGLDTAVGTLPEIGRLDAAAIAMQNLGQNVSQLGSHMLTRARQKDDTTAATLYQEEQMKAAESTNRTIDENDTPDGSGMTDVGVTTIRNSNNEALNQIPPRLRKEYATRFDHLQRRHALHLSNVEDTKRTGYYGGKAEEFATNKSITISEDINSYESLKKENDTYIDNMPITPAAKERIKNSTNAILSNGLADGEFKKNPQKLKERLGGTVTKSTSGGTIPSGTIDTRQRDQHIAFVWHELAGDPKAGMGAGSETAAYQRLKAANTLEQAVKAGLSFERPAIWNTGVRLKFAQEVFTGNTTAAGLRARAFFESKGLTRIQASGMVGALMGESGRNLNPGSENKLDPGTSIGVGQWNRTRKANLLQFIKSFGGEPGAGLSAPMPSVPESETTTVTSEVAPEYANMSYEWRKARLNKVDADLKQQQEDEYVAAATRTKQVASDAIATIQAQGDVTDLAEPTLSDFIMSNKGDTDKGIASWTAYQTSKDAAMLAYKFKTMSRWEIDDALEQYKLNIPEGEGAALGETLYSGLQSAAREAAGPKEAEEKFDQYMKDLWDKTTKEVEEDRTKKEDAQKNFDYNMRLMWNSAQAAVDKDSAEFALKQYKAAEAARKLALEGRDKNPWDYTTGGTPGERNAAFPSVKAAWDVVSQTPANTPGYTSMTAVAIDTTYHAQKQLGVQTHNMQLLDPRYVDAVIGSINDDANEVSMTQKMNKLASVFTMTTDPHYKAIIFNQFKKAGLPNEMRFALDAFERGDTGAYSMLFYPALSKNLKPTDDIKMAKYREEADKLVNSPLGQAEFGSGLMDERSVENVSSASKLMTNFAIMNGGDPTQSAATAFLMMIGPRHHVTSTLGYGTKVNASADDKYDDDKLTDGFNNLTVDVTMAYMSNIDLNDPVARTKANQSVASGSFVNYEDGYAFRTLSGRVLIDPSKGEVMKWTATDVLAAAERKDNRVPEKVLRGFGLLPQDVIMPEGPLLEIPQIPTPNQRKGYTPTETDRLFQLYGGR